MKKVKWTKRDGFFYFCCLYSFYIQSNALPKNHLNGKNSFINDTVDVTLEIKFSIFHIHSTIQSEKKEKAEFRTAIQLLKESKILCLVRDKLYIVLCNQWPSSKRTNNFLCLTRLNFMFILPIKLNTRSINTFNDWIRVGQEPQVLYPTSKWWRYIELFVSLYLF